jgi:hypothetical protein
MSEHTAEDRDYYDALYDSIPSDVPDTVWESDALSKGAGQ